MEKVLQSLPLNWLPLKVQNQIRKHLQSVSEYGRCVTNLASIDKTGAISTELTALLKMIAMKYVIIVQGVHFNLGFFNKMLKSTVFVQI